MKDLPRWADNILMTYQMEDQIGIQGKQDDYYNCLSAFVFNDCLKSPGFNLGWKIAHATPRQRVLAALKAYGVEAPEIKNV